MDTTSILTLRLAEAIGLYLILIGISGLASPGRWRGAIEELNRSPALTLVTGLVAFALGATIVMVHRAFADPLSIIVTLVGYIALIKGALLIAVPGPLMKVGDWSFRFTRAWAAFALILGILLFYAGLTGRATVLV
ncbi:DUF2065 family protein [Sphingobium cloacae]|uniref:DUF2065 domain-containing protein n=1 Tax=Sphingobium cloacae TaxID=120107 RepID=A0A1E1F387_9SPHN|nr:DUF2065 family protein [Sphingobium cloacae]BAV64989.1 hypothetical protein SCLO_1019490 [Sphingobium cloacae]